MQSEGQNHTDTRLVSMQKKKQTRSAAVPGRPGCGFRRRLAASSFYARSLQIRSLTSTAQ